MVTLNAHFDGRTIVPDAPGDLPFKSGTRLRVSIEPLVDAASDATSRRFEPLNIRIDPALADSIARDPELGEQE